MDKFLVKKARLNITEAGNDEGSCSSSLSDKSEIETDVTKSEVPSKRIKSRGYPGRVPISPHKPIQIQYTSNILRLSRWGTNKPYPI